MCANQTNPKLCTNGQLRAVNRESRIMTHGERNAWQLGNVGVCGVGNVSNFSKILVSIIFSIAHLI